MKSVIINLLADWAKTYLKNCVDKLVDKGIDKTASVLAALTSLLFILLMSFLAFIFMTVTLALYIGNYLGEVYLGFLVVTCLYFLISFDFYLFRISWLKKPLAKKIREKLKNEL